MENKDIYIITTSWGEYEMNHDAYEGYVYTEDEAIDAVKQLDEKYNIIHPIACKYDEFNESFEYNKLKNEFDQIYYDWEDIYSEKHEEFQEKNNIGFLIKTNKSLYKELNDKFDSDMREYRIKWFEENNDIQKYLPDGCTWGEILDLYDLYIYVTQEYYCGARYEKISYFKN